MHSDLISHVNTSKQVTLGFLSENYPVLEIKNLSASATIALHGAHLTNYTPSGEKPVIFTSDHAVYKEGKAIRGGIPICWPYFNAHPSNTNAPSHGFARNRFWELTSIIDSDDSTTLTFNLPMTTDDFSLVGGTCELSLIIIIGTSLTISLNTKNTDSKDLTVGGALHSYFNVESITNTSISGLDGVEHLDTIVNQTTINESDIVFTQEYDRIFIPSDHLVTVNDLGHKRKLLISKENSNATTIWNPWIQKSASMADLGNEDYKTFLCVEAINWREDLRTITPGESHSLTQKIQIL